MKKVIATTIAVLILGALIFFFLSDNWMMTTCFYRNNERMATILNAANKSVSEYKHLDVTFTKDEVVGEKTTNIITSNIKVSIREEGAYDLYAEKTLYVDEEAVLQRVYFTTEDNIVYLTQEGKGDKEISAATINDAIKVATCTYADHDTITKTLVTETALLNDIGDILDYTEVKEEDMEDYNSSFLFTFSPFQVGVDFTIHTTTDEDTTAFNEIQYRIGFGGKILDKIIKFGIEGAEATDETEAIEANYVKIALKYNTHGSFVAVPMLPESTEMAD